jgi:hypothetical protein
MPIGPAIEAQFPQPEAPDGIPGDFPGVARMAHIARGFAHDSPRATLLFEANSD